MKLRNFRALYPAIPASTHKEAIRAGFGALIGLGIAGFVLSFLDLQGSGLYLIAPFGASSVLLFAVPNSPLAQPWSAIVGNSVAALAGVAVCYVIPDPVLRVAVAVGLAITVMIVARAVHPPGGAVAMVVAMNPDIATELGFRFALTPVAAITAILVLTAVLYARATGRKYPLRHFDDKSPFQTTDRSPIERLGLDEGELNTILQQYRQSLNLGVEDLARLIGAAEFQVAAHRAGPITAGQIMSRDLVTVNAQTPLSEVADLFRRHGFTSLPVIQDDGRFIGVIFQIHLIRRATEDALRLDRGLLASMARLIDRRRNVPIRAIEIMSVTEPRATANTPIAALLPLMADGACDAVPVLEDNRIIGIVTRTDLIAALAHAGLKG
ncbi:HPP family protein [Thalassospira xiamenensis]|uniref:HPP family protein n=1 Tax=Thalassospira xiamenensis TaxID=220697 RepID=UPI001FFF65CC|nr:HPP family protein [Thalassospira xiamenensis]MCK2168017.1 HPP family protein [Thalassospira xiamenensis]